MGRDSCVQLCRKSVPLYQCSVTTDAESDKCQKCKDFLDNYYFQPVAIETTGVYGKSTAPFFNCLAKKLVDISGDPRE